VKNTNHNHATKKAHLQGSSNQQAMSDQYGNYDPTTGKYVYYNDPNYHQNDQDQNDQDNDEDNTDESMDENEQDSFNDQNNDGINDDDQND
jgi:hypothetical protein